MPVEKNDVSINKLLNWGKKFIINDKNGKRLAESYIRLVGDADLNRARTFALRKSAELRKKFKDENSDEYLAYIPDFTDFEKEAIIEVMVTYSYAEHVKIAYKEVKLAYPVEPSSDAPQKALEEYQAQVDEYPTKLTDKIKDYVSKLNSELRKSLQSKPRDELIKLFKDITIDTICRQEMEKKFKDFCVYKGSFIDPQFTKPVFNSFEDFDNLISEVKQQYIINYDSLELGADELKK